MKYLLLLFMLPFISASECSKKKKGTVAEDKKELSDSIPACLQHLIDIGNKETPPNGPKQIDEYLYKEKKAYLLMAQCCDQFDMLYDENCKEICSPTGGFSGRGDGRCPEFIREAKLVKTIWKEKEEPKKPQ